MRHAALFLSTLLVGTCGLSSLALAQSQTVSPPLVGSVMATSQPSQFAQFVPNPSKSLTLDYKVWDEMLKEMVYYTGPSLRQRAPAPKPVVGTRRVFGHTSPYRLEGNKVVFESMGDDFKSVLSDYVIDLERIGNQVDISTLPRNEQLAYWINLHNALTIHALSEAYPLQYPEEISDNAGRAFHDISRVTINGISLSLRNIREDIVYTNWNDPLVIYGFFHGDLGSPSIQRKAYTSANLQETLKFSADEFANSLRGIMVYGKNPHISKHYQDAAPYFFPNFETDVRAHLISLTNENVTKQLMKATNPFKIAKYESSIADLTKGEAHREPLSQVITSNEFGTFGPPTVLARAISEQTEKFRRIRKRGLFGSVTIEDIQTVDVEDFGTSQGPSSIYIGPLPEESGTGTIDEIQTETPE